MKGAALAFLQPKAASPMTPRADGCAEINRSSACRGAARPAFQDRSRLTAP